MSPNKYFLSGISSCVIWGFLPIVWKMLAVYDPYEVILCRIAGAALALLLILSVPFVFASVKRYDLQQAWHTLRTLSWQDFTRTFILSALGGVLLTSNWVAYIYVVNEVSVSAAAFAYLIMPVVTAFLALLFFRESFSRPQWIALGLAMISCYLLFQHISLHNMLYVCTVTLSYAVYILTQKKNTYLPQRVNVCIQMIVGLVMMFFMMGWVDPHRPPLLQLPITFWAWIEIVALIFTVLPLLLNLYAIQGMRASQLAILVYVNPVIAFLIGVVIYGEQLRWVSAMAYALMVLAVVLFNWDLIKQLGSRDHTVERAQACK